MGGSMVESRGESRVATRVESRVATRVESRVESMVGSMVESMGRCIRQRVRGRVRGRGRNGRVDPLTSWPVGRGSAFGNGVRHIIAARDEARPHALAADQQGRWSLPARNARKEATGKLDSALDSALRTLSSVSVVGLTVHGRPRTSRDAGPYLETARVARGAVLTFDGRAPCPRARLPACPLHFSLPA